MENFNEMFIKEIRKKFQDSNTRMSMMLLMLDEIKLQEMQKQNKQISYTEAMGTLEEEFKDMKEAILARERNAVIGTFMKDMGL